MTLHRILKTILPGGGEAGIPAPAAARPAPGCLGCAFFSNHPQALESLFPGLATFSSGSASVRADDGLCHRHGRYLSARSSCPERLAR